MRLPAARQVDLEYIALVNVGLDTLDAAEKGLRFIFRQRLQLQRCGGNRRPVCAGKLLQVLRQFRTFGAHPSPLTLPVQHNGTTRSRQCRHRKIVLPVARDYRRLQQVQQFVAEKIDPSAAKRQLRGRAGNACGAILPGAFECRPEIRRILHAPQLRCGIAMKQQIPAFAAGGLQQQRELLRLCRAQSGEIGKSIERRDKHRGPGGPAARLRYQLQRLKTNVPLVPPKPNELEMA